MRVVILGSTGSIGVQALDVVRSNPTRLRVVGLATGRHREGVTRQAEEFGVPAWRALTCAGDPSALAGLAALPEADVVLNAVVGLAGLPATIAALEAGKRLALANKESLVAAGEAVSAARKRGGGEIVPVDSEHSAIYQALLTGRADQVARLLLTASGGPFRGRRGEELRGVTRAEALAHPTWSMGPKITVDSSTLMNKGLEVIEAHELFGVAFERIEVVVHPESVVHGMVEWSDGSTVAQLSVPDMRLPIAYALCLPVRAPGSVGSIDWTRLGTLRFEPVDHDAFPCLGLAYEAGRRGGSAPAVLNGANEVAVEAFLAERLRWGAIAEVVSEVLAAHPGGNAATFDEVVDVDAWARDRAWRAVERRSSW